MMFWSNSELLLKLHKCDVIATLLEACRAIFIKYELERMDHIPEFHAALTQAALRMGELKGNIHV